MGIRCSLERLNPIFQSERVCHKPLQVHHSTRHNSYRSWPHIDIPLLELDIHLIRTTAHEGDLHLFLPYTDNEDFSPKFDGLYRVTD